jgi:hypothetical protein
MTSALRSYPSTSHVFALTPPVAAVAFDIMILDPAVAADLIPAGPLRRAQPRGYDYLRALPATLRLPGRRGRGLAVTLELLPWSDHRSELTISTTARPHLSGERTIAAYVQAAQRSLIRLAELMDAGHLTLDRSRCLDGVGGSVQPAAAGHRGAAVPDPRRTLLAVHERAPKP